MEEEDFNGRTKPLFEHFSNMDNGKDKRHQLRLAAGPALDLEVFDLEETLVDVADALEPTGQVLSMNLPRRSRSRGRDTRKSAKCPPATSVKAFDSRSLSPEQLCLLAANGESAVLNLARCGIEDIFVHKELVPSLTRKSSKVNTLILTRNHLSDEGAASLATLVEHNHACLTRLDINQNNIGDKGMRALSAALEKNTHLCRIDMSWNGDVEEDTKLDIIHKLIRNLTARGQLQLHKENVALELYLNGLALGCSGVCKVIEMLAKNTVICRFNFADNDIREVGAAAIFEWLNRSATVTTHIDLDENYDMDDQMKEKIAALLVKNRSLPSLFLQRYRIDQGPCLHRSATSVVYAAADMRAPGIAGSRVALKCTFLPSSLKCELKARLQLTSISNGLIAFHGYHVPERYRYESIVPHSTSETTSALLCAPQAERTKPSSFGCSPLGGPDPETSTKQERDLFVSVMELADRSMLDLCAKQRVAGYDLGQIQSLFRQLVEHVLSLHQSNIVHGDIKPRNILLRSLEDSAKAKATDEGVEPGWAVVLCDLDCAKLVEEVYQQSDKIGSSGYLAPEIVRWQSYPENHLHARTTQDIWSLGCILFELCTGMTLFRQDMNNDMIVETTDVLRMHTWHTISDAELHDVLRIIHSTSPTTVLAAKQLIRWCLKANPSERPTCEEILSHEFLMKQESITGRPSLLSLPMQYRFFISHAQADAASTAKAMYEMFRHLGVHCWYDMQQETLTLKGMKHGVKESDIFLLVLTKFVLTRWFCQQEILTAIQEKKRIQLLVEEDPRFRPFDVEAWNRHDPDVRRFNTDTVDDYNKIVQAVDAALPSMVVYRRRDYEADAMLHELCLRGGAPVPIQEPLVSPRTSLTVQVLCRRGGKGDIYDDIMEALKLAATNFVIQEDLSTLQSADKVLALLTEDALNGDRSSYLTSLVRVIEADKDVGKGQDRLIFVCQTEAGGWIFGNGNQSIAAAPKCVQDALNEHEAITYRSRRHTHEFNAMKDHLQEKLMENCRR